MYLLIDLCVGGIILKRTLSKLLSGVMVAAMMFGGMQTDVFAAR